MAAFDSTVTSPDSGNKFIPQLWAGTILRSLENNLVANKICNTEFTGEVKRAGDTVFFNGLEDPTIGDYKIGKSGGITYEALESTRKTLLIDQQNYFAFEVEDIIKAQANMDLQNSQANRAAYALKDKCDKYILADVAGATSAVGANNKVTATVTSANILSSIGMMAQKLDEANVPNEQKWIVISPAVKLKLMLAGIKFQIAEGIKGGTGVEFTKDLGFNLYVSNNLKKTTASSKDTFTCIGGSKNAIVFADQIMDTEVLTLESKFAKAVRGLHVYGASIIKPAELVQGIFTVDVETSI